MKKLSLVILAAFTSLSLFANFNTVVKPGKGLIMRETISEYFKQKNISLKDLGQVEDKKAIFNIVDYWCYAQEICFETNEIICPLGNITRTEWFRTIKVDVWRSEKDDDYNLISQAIVNTFNVEESGADFDCPEPE
jgi:hypothetical protein